MAAHSGRHEYTAETSVLGCRQTLPQGAGNELSASAETLLTSSAADEAASQECELTDIASMRQIWSSVSGSAFPQKSFSRLLIPVSLPPLLLMERTSAWVKADRKFSEL